MKLTSYILPFSFATFFLFAGNINAQKTIKLRNKNQTVNIGAQHRQKEKLARYYYLGGQYEKAAELFKELYNEKPNYYYYYSYYLNSLIYLKRFDEAIKLTKKQSKKFDKNYRYTVDYAYVLEQSGNKKKSKKIIKKLIDKIPLNRNGVINIANALQSKGYAKEAIEVYEKASHMPYNKYSYNLERANAYRLTGEYAKMFDAYLAYVDENPDNLQLVKNRLQSTLLYDVDNDLSGMLKKKLLLKVQKHPDNFAFNDLLLWLSVQTGDFETALRQARAIDRRFGNHEEEVYNLAKIALNNKKYEIASKAFEYLKNKGKESDYYSESYAGWLTTEIIRAENNPQTSKEKFSEIDNLGEKFINELSITPETEETVLQLAKIKAFYLDKPADAQKLLKKIINIPDLSVKEKAKAKLLMGDVLMFEKKIWDASLYYSQVELDLKNEPLGHKAKFKNAMLFYYQGEYKWAQARLDILKSATSKLISNDAIEMSMFIHDVTEEDTLGFTIRQFGIADLYATQNRPDSAMFWLKKIEHNAPGPVSYQFALFKEAKLLKQIKRYGEADTLFRKLAGSYPESIKADDALFAAAQIEEIFLNRKKEAAKLYLKIMKQYPESVFTPQARKRYRKLSKQTENGKNGTS